MIEIKGLVYTRGRKELTKTTAQQYAVCHTQPRRGNIEDQTNFNDGDVEGNYHPQTRIQGSGRQWPAASRETNPFEALNDSRHSTMTKAASRPRSRSPLKGPRIETAGSLVGVLVGVPMGLWVIGCLQSNYNPGYLHQIIFIDYNALASILSKDCECSAILSL